MPVWHHGAVMACATRASRQGPAGALLSLGQCQVGEASASPPSQLLSV